MNYFSVKNFEKFQHYKDRSPPWIKLYNDLLDDYEFGRLQDASKMHLVAIWLLASRYENEIPWDAKWIATRINAKSPVDLDALESAGFIQKINMVQNASDALAERKQTARPETEGETEVEKKDISSEKDFDEWYSAYPRHEAKGAARKAYATARKKADHATLLAGAKRFSANPPSDPKFIPLPASWLNAERWADEPARNQAGSGSTASSAGPAISDIESQWRARLRAYKPRGFWSPAWGNRPEDGNKDIPPRVYEAWRDGTLAGAA